MVRKPIALEIWEDECAALRAREPRVCFNCFNVTEQTGRCRVHGEVPPADFAETPGACPDWKDVVPF